jgi:hypothetical protein
MKTLEIKLYSFLELSKEAQEKAIEQYRKSQNGYFDDYDAANTFEKFAKIFNINKYDIDYLEPYRNNYKTNLDDAVLDLSGVKLYKYIVNNYKDILSKDCPLTGVFYDEAILQPIHNFLKKPYQDINFYKLLDRCIKSFCEAVADDIQNQNSDNYISEFLEANEYQFLESGKIFTL